MLLDAGLVFIINPACIKLAVWQAVRFNVSDWKAVTTYKMMASSPVRQRRRSSIRKEFSEQELQDLRTAFGLIDSNQDGQIHCDELKVMLKNLGIQLDDQIVEHLIRGASHTGNELIDENDFLSWVKQIQELRPEEDAHDDAMDLMEAFRVFDLDNNGYITRDELRIAMEMIGEPVTEMQLTEFINLADTDNDGKINYEEFARLLL